MDWRGASIIHQWGGPGAGLFISVDPDGRVRFADREQPQARVQRGSKGRPGAGLSGVVLGITGTPIDSGRIRLVFATHVVDEDRTPALEKISELALEVPGSRCLGNVALVAHPGERGQGTPVRWWFQHWSIAGERVEDWPDRTFGPVACAQHTLSRGVMKMTAQLLPVAAADAGTARLVTKGPTGRWQTVARAPVVVPGWTATFKVKEWPAQRDVSYRVEYDLLTRNGDPETHRFDGVVLKDPVDKDEIVVAGFTGNHNNSHAIGRRRTDWPNGMWFPHDDLVRNVRRHDPDLLFFSGDQVYEGRSPTFADRKNIKLDYLYKWYLWCWAYRDLTRRIPCVTIPDDHDVYQGNIWGEGGRKARVDNHGGYVHPADFVKMVERTQTSHLPDPADPTPIEQGIGVYHSRITYGRIGLAVLEDRKFKSGCGNGRLPDSGTRRADHINNPEFDVMRADIEGLSLLGSRQLKFVDDWAADWTGEDMKMALSQTVFAGMATHHGGNLQRLIADLDSNGWPQSGRNRAIRALRKGFAFHLAGDQHLATIVHHGVDDWGDGIWSFCVPSIANFYPRKWFPEAVGKNRPDGAPTWMGEHVDGLRNKVTVYAATNPGPISGREPAALHDKMPGYGIVRMRKSDRTITMECWPRYAVPGRDAQYPGWPKTIRQWDNYARKPAGWLPTLRIKGPKNPVVQVVDERSDEIVYTLRILGNVIQPWVFDVGGTYTVRVGDDGGRTLTGQKATAERGDRVVDIDM